MSVKEIFDMIYALLIVVAIIAYSVVRLYSLKHEIKNKWIAQIPDLAAGFVHEAETTGGNGTAKMDIVVTSVCNILRNSGIKITPDIESAIKAFAEKEVAKMNAAKPADDHVDEAQSVDDFDENKVIDNVKGSDSNA